MLPKDFDMFNATQKRDLLQINFPGFFSFFSGVCPALM